MVNNLLFAVISLNCPGNIYLIKSYYMSVMLIYVLPLIRYLKTDFSSAVTADELSFLFLFYYLKREFLMARE